MHQNFNDSIQFHQAAQKMHLNIGSYSETLRFAVLSFHCSSRSCIVTLQNFFMCTFCIFYVYQKFRMHAWMQHRQLSSKTSQGRK